MTFWTNCPDQLFESVIADTLERIGGKISYQKVTFDGRYDSDGKTLFAGTMIYPAKGECILAMGSGPLELLQKEGLIPKNRKIMKSRGIVTKYKQGAYMCTFDPSIINVDISKDPMLRWDIRLIERYHRTGSLDPIIGEYEWVDDFSATIQYIKDEFADTGKPVKTALDLETMGLVPFIPDKKIVTVAFTVQEGQAEVCYMYDKPKEQRQRIIKQIKWLLTSPMVSIIGANLKYDLIWLRVKYAAICTNFKMDTLLVGTLLNENRANSLKDHACEYAVDLGGYEHEFESKFDKSEMEKVPKDEPSFLTYAGGDTAACLQVSNIMRKELKNNKSLQHFYVKILHPAARAFEEIEYHGICVDKDRFAEVRQIVKDDVNECYAKLVASLPRRLRLKHAHRQEDKEYGLLQPAVLKDFLFTPAGLNLKPLMKTKKTDEPQITKDHLFMFLDNPEAAAFIKTYKQFVSSDKTITTFIDGFLKHLRPDGRFHPTYALFNGDLFGQGNEKDEAGTDSGRLSTRAPAIHVNPKHTRWAKLLRSCYTCPPGHVIFQIDFKEGELRIAACRADDTTMIEAYKKGHSLHALTGSKLSQMSIADFMQKKKNDPDFYAVQRQKSKAINFGFIFGLQAKGFKDYARNSFDLEVTKKEAEDFRNLFFSTYSDLESWHSRETNTAHRDKQVVSPLGRVRRLPLISSPNWKIRSKQERRAINAPVQGTLSDLCAWGITFIRARFTMQEVWIAGMTHDSCYGYIPEDYAVERLREIKQIMENLPVEKEFGWTPQIDFPVDAEMSFTNLADLEGIEL